MSDSNSKFDPVSTSEWEALSQRRLARVDVDRGRRIVASKIARQSVHGFSAQQSGEFMHTGADGKVTSASPSLSAATQRSEASSFWQRRFSHVAGILFGAIVISVGWQLSAPVLGQWLGNDTAVLLDGVESPFTYSTADGQQATLVLPDGSTVVLNVGSKLSIPSDYAQGNRTISLSGEASFNVKSSTKSPFVVQAGPSTTRVLGTEFLVRYYETDTVAVIAVRDGKVAVESTVLSALQQVAVTEVSVGEVQDAIMSQFEFTSGLLAFDNTPMPEAIAQLNRWYDADIRLGDSAIASQRLSGKFRTGSITDLSAILRLMFNVRVEQAGRVVTLYSL